MSHAAFMFVKTRQTFWHSSGCINAVRTTTWIYSLKSDTELFILKTKPEFYLNFNNVAATFAANISRYIKKKYESSMPAYFYMLNSCAGKYSFKIRSKPVFQLKVKDVKATTWNDDRYKHSPAKLFSLYTVSVAAIQVALESNKGIFHFFKKKHPKF